MDVRVGGDGSGPVGGGLGGTSSAVGMLKPWDAPSTLALRLCERELVLNSSFVCD